MIPDSVTSIGKYAFFDCSSLVSITIPKSVTSIGSGAFVDCSGLESVYITDLAAWCEIEFADVTANPMRNGAKIYLNNTKILTVTDLNVSEIKAYTFYGFCDLIYIDIPESVTSIGSGAFGGCKNLKSVFITDLAAWCEIEFADLHANPMYYAKEIYLNDEKIVTVTELNVSEIKKYTFFGFSDLVSIDIPESVTSIGNSAFYGCESLISIPIPAGVTSIGEYAFYGCSSLKYVYISDLAAWCGIEFADLYANPMYYAKEIFLNNQAIETVTGLNVSEIKAYTFCGFRDLVRIDIPKNVTSIGDYAFFGCSSLSSITISEGVTSIGDSTFSGCKSLISIKIPAGVTSIGECAFYGCSSLNSITIPNSVTRIRQGAFRYCINLKSVHITDLAAWCKIEFDGVEATPMFYAEKIYLNNQPIETVTGLNVSEIKAYTFYGFSDMVHIDIPKNVTSIGVSAFSGCGSLKRVEIQNLAAFLNISFGNEDANPLYYAHNLYLNGSLVETLEIPEGTTVMKAYALAGATCIKKVYVPKSLQRFNANAFYGCFDVTQIYYAGSRREWQFIGIGAYNGSLNTAEVFCNSTLDDCFCVVSCEVCDGGQVSVGKHIYDIGETVKVTAIPYDGYQLTGVYVNRTLIEGNTYTVAETGNHTISAVFELLPGGTADLQINGIEVRNGAGEKQQTIPNEKAEVTVSLRNQNASGSSLILLACYAESGQYLGMICNTVDEIPADSSDTVTLNVDNTDNEIAVLKAFAVTSFESAVPVGNVVTYGNMP